MRQREVCDEQGVWISTSSCQAGFLSATSPAPSVHQLLLLPLSSELGCTSLVSHVAPFSWTSASDHAGFSILHAHMEATGMVTMDTNPAKRPQGPCLRWEASSCYPPGSLVEEGRRRAWTTGYRQWIQHLLQWLQWDIRHSEKDSISRWSPPFLPPLSHPALFPSSLFLSPLLAGSGIQPGFQF